MKHSLVMEEMEPCSNVDIAKSPVILEQSSLYIKSEQECINENANKNNVELNSLPLVKAEEEHLSKTEKIKVEPFNNEVELNYEPLNCEVDSQNPEQKFTPPTVTNVDVKHEPLLSVNTDNSENLVEKKKSDYDVCKTTTESRKVNNSLNHETEKIEKQKPTVIDVCDSDSDDVDPFDLEDDVIPLTPAEPVDPLQLDPVDNLAKQSTSLFPSCPESQLQSIGDSDDDDVIPLQEEDPLGDIEMQPTTITSDIFSPKLKTKKKKKPKSLEDADEIYICDKCDYSTWQRSRLQRHYKRHGPRVDIHCTHCNYKTTRRVSMTTHLLKHTTNATVFKCSECNYSILNRSSFDSHMLNHKSKEPLECSVCKYTTLYKSNLELHQWIHKDGFPLECPTCSFSRCEGKVAFMEHLRGHMFEERPYSCTECSYTTTHKSSLNRHIIKHKGVKAYPCPLCPYNAIYKNNLKAHMIKHTGEKPHKCTLCPFKGLYKSTLLNHIRKHHPSWITTAEINGLMTKDESASMVPTETLQLAPPTNGSVPLIIPKPPPSRFTPPAMQPLPKKHKTNDTGATKEIESNIFNQFQHSIFSSLSDNEPSLPTAPNRNVALSPYLQQVIAESQGPFMNNGMYSTPKQNSNESFNIPSFLQQALSESQSKVKDFRPPVQKLPELPSVSVSSLTSSNSSFASPQLNIPTPPSLTFTSQSTNCDVSISSVKTDQSNNAKDQSSNSTPLLQSTNMSNILAKLAAKANAFKSNSHQQERVQVKETQSSPLPLVIQPDLLKLLPHLNPEISINPSQSSPISSPKEFPTRHRMEPKSDEIPSISIYPCASNGVPIRGPHQNMDSILSFQRRMMYPNYNPINNVSNSIEPSLPHLRNTFPSTSATPPLPLLPFDNTQLAALLFLQRQQQLNLQSLFPDKYP